MALPALAQLSDVVALLGHDVTPAQQTYIATLLNTASNKVRRYIRQDITQSLGDVVVLNGTWRTRLTLPQRPVTNVSSVAVRGNTIMPGSFAWDRAGHIDLVSASATWTDFDNIFGAPAQLATGASTLLTGTAPMLSGPGGSIYPDIQSGPSWSGPAARITITYDHGWVEIPGDIVDEVAGMVAAQMSVPVGVLHESIGGYKVGYIRPPGGAMTLTDEAKKNLNQYRIRATSTNAGLPR